MKKTVLPAILFILVALVSCNQEAIVHGRVDNGDLCEVFMDFVVPKSLYSIAPDEISRYEYKAIPETSPMDQYDHNGLNLFSVAGNSISSNSVTATVVADSDSYASITVTGTATATATLKICSRQLTQDDLGTWTFAGCWSGTSSTSQPYQRLVIRTTSSGPMVGTYKNDTGSGCTVQITQTNINSGNWLCLEIVVPNGYDCTANRVSFSPFLVKGSDPNIMENDIFGATDWRPVSLDEYGRASLGYFSQGLWSFQARALTASGAVIYGPHSSEHIYIAKTQKNAVIMHLQMPSDGGLGKASLFFDILTPSLEAAQSDYTLRCWATPLTYNMNAAWSNHLGNLLSSTGMTWDVHTGTLTATMSGNTEPPTITVKTYYDNAFRNTITSGVAIDGQWAVIGVSKEDIINRLSIEIVGNGSTSVALFDLTDVPWDMYWLHFHREFLTDVNTVVLSQVMLTDSEFPPYGYSATSGYTIEAGARTEIPVEWTVTHIEKDDGLGAFDAEASTHTAASLAEWNALAHVLTATMTGNTASPTVTVKKYYNTQMMSTLRSAVETKGENVAIGFQKQNTFNRLAVEVNGNGGSVVAFFDISGLTNGVTYYLHFFRDPYTGHNTVILRDLMVTDSESPAKEVMRFIGAQGGFDQGVYRIESELILLVKEAGEVVDTLNIAGQGLMVKLISGSTTQILGRMDGGAYINGSYSLTEDKTEFSGYITCAGHVRTDTTGNQGSLNAGVDESVTLIYVENPGSTHATSIDWYLDGTKMATTTNGTWTTSFSAIGEHEVSALLLSEDEQKTGTAVVLLFVGV